MQTQVNIFKCPFCGSGRSQIREIDIGTWAVVCESCGGAGPVGEDGFEAVFGWDSRTALQEVSSSRS